jgi:hypothetical protein
MPNDHRIQLDLSSRQKRVIRSAVVAGAVIGALGLGVAIAAPKNTFKANDPLSSQKMNENFDDLDARIGAVETKPVITKGGKQYSTFATFCGMTSATYDGKTVGGYAGAKSKCEAASSCGNSPSAHMCTAEEMVRSVQLSVPVTTADGWYATGVRAWGGNNLAANDDCEGWVYNTDGYGADWGGGALPGSRPNHSGCANLLPIRCCD